MKQKLSLDSFCYLDNALCVDRKLSKKDRRFCKLNSAYIFMFFFFYEQC